MEANKSEYYSLADITASVKSFMGYLLRKWWLFLVAAFVGIGFASLYYWLQKPKYEAETTFILEEKSGGGGGLAGLASQFGFDIGSLSGSGNIFAGDNILDILKSKNIVVKVLLSKVDSSQGANGPTLADLYMDFNKWEKSKAFTDISYANAGQVELSLKQDSVMSLIYTGLVKQNISVERVSKKGSIISASVISQHQVFSKLMAERIVNEARNLYIGIKSGVALANVKRLERKADSILAQLNSKTYLAASSFQNDANPALKMLNVPVEISSRDKTVLGAVYLELVKMLEMNRTILNQQTPVLQLLDVPQLPIRNTAKSFIFLSFVFIFFSSVVTGVYLLFKFNTMESSR